MKSPIAFLLEDLARDLVASDLADVIGDLDTASFEPRVLFLRGDARAISSAQRAALGDAATLAGPLRKPFWNVGLVRRVLLGVGKTRPTVLVVTGRAEVLDLAPRVIGWLGAPAVYLAPSGDADFPWGRRPALDGFAKIVAGTGRLTLRLVDELRVPESRVATIYPGVDAERFDLMPLAVERRDVVGVVGDPPPASIAALEAALGGAARVERVAGAAASSPDALARFALFAFLSDSDWDSGYVALLRGMAIGRPVVAAVPSERIDDLVLDGETGRLVASGAPDAADEAAAAAAAIRELFAAPDLLASMGIAARMRIAGEFGRARRAADFDGLLRVVGGIPFPPPKLPGPATAPGLDLRFKPLK